MASSSKTHTNYFRKRIAKTIGDNPDTLCNLIVVSSPAKPKKAELGDINRLQVCFKPHTDCIETLKLLVWHVVDIFPPIDKHGPRFEIQPEEKRYA